jgi:hypothetical protein
MGNPMLRRQGSTGDGTLQVPRENIFWAGRQWEAAGGQRVASKTGVALRRKI